MINGIDYYRRYEPVFKYWTIDRFLGEGASGEVFEISCRAPDGKVHRSAMKAICIPKSDTEFKILQNDGFTPESANRYLDELAGSIENEYSFMAKFNGHPNIVGYEDHVAIKHENGVGWDILIKMQLLKPYTSYSESRSMTDSDIVKLGIHMCKALEECHCANVIHRDIKPENIFVDEFGNFKLGDFGIARELDRTQTGLTKIGTPTYMAPEVYKDEAYGKTVDIYSLGLVLYKALNYGRTPFLPKFPQEINYGDKEKAFFERMKGTTIPYPDGTSNKALCEAVIKACSFKAEDRFQSAKEFGEVLEELSKAGSVTQKSASEIVYEASSKIEVTEPVKKNLEQAEKKKISKKSVSKKRGIIAAMSCVAFLAAIAIFIAIVGEKWQKNKTVTPVENDIYDDLAECAHTEKKYTILDKVYTSPFEYIEKRVPFCSKCAKSFQWEELHSFESSDGVNDYGELSDTIFYVLYDDGTLSIRGEGDMPVLYEPAHIFVKLLRPETWESAKKVTIENNIISIGDYSFYECGLITDVVVPKTASGIGHSAFSNCYNLSDINIPNSVTSIGDMAFRCCYSFNNITIPNSVTSIGNSAFANCYEMVSITIPDSVTSIGEYAFKGCNNLVFKIYSGSYAETYAKENNIKYEIIDSDENDSTENYIKPIGTE